MVLGDPDYHYPFLRGRVERFQGTLGYSRSSVACTHTGMKGIWIPLNDCPIDSLRISLPNNKLFDFQGYVTAMQKGSQWLANRLPAMETMIKQWLRANGDTARLETSERTLASYVFQEKEGISRGAKIDWCTNRGHTVHNLQHDGIIIQLCRNETPEDARKAIERRCGRVLGYTQPITADK